MIRQKSYNSNVPTLYLVPTPIGNLSDMTPRAVEVLNQVNTIYCEDTRVTKVLLSHFQISTPLKSYHLFNEAQQANQIIDLLKEGKDVALVSDAGLPCISDPGYLISKLAIDEGFSVVSLPGANAALTALIASGLPSEKFYFHGFLPSKSSQRKAQLESLKTFPHTLLFYEAPHRIALTLEDMLEVFSNREVVIAREISKKYEEYIRGSLEEIISQVEGLKGEIVVVVRGYQNTTTSSELLDLTIQEHVQYYIDQGLSEKEAMKEVANNRNCSKSDIYRVFKIQ